MVSFCNNNVNKVSFNNRAVSWAINKAADSLLVDRMAAAVDNSNNNKEVKVDSNNSNLVRIAL